MTVLAPGETFAGYRIDGVLGRGGMGVVYRAYDVSLERPVALKLIAPELAEDSRFRERFLRETRIAASLEHPHILPVHAAGEHEGSLFLAMRFVEGEDLASRLARDGRLEPERALEIAGQVAGAIDAAHARGLVHRDVKPSNVLVASSGESYLCDFGLTKRTSSQSGLTATGEFVGTLDYLAPEQIRGGTADGRADQYALACLLYECLAGEPPFRRETDAQTLWAHMQDPPPSVRASRLELPAAIDEVLRKALAKEPEERYATCGAFVAAAREALGVGVEVRRAPLLPAVLRRRGKLVALIGALIVAGAAVAAAVQLTRDSRPSGIASVAPNSVAVIDPATNEIVAQVPVGRNPTAIAVGEGAVWVVNGDDRTISRIDPETKDERRLGTGGVPIDIAAGAGAVWVLNAATESGPPTTRTVTRIDPETEATLTIELPAGDKFDPGRVQGARQLAIGGGAVFAVTTGETIARIDPRTNEVVESIDPGGSPDAIAFGDGALWARDGSALVRIDLESGEVAEPVEVGSILVSGVAAGAGLVWATETVAGTLWRVEPRGVSRTIDVGAGATDVVFADGAVWVAATQDGALARVDPGGGSVETIPIGNTPQAVAVGAGAVWVAVAEGVSQPPAAEDVAAPLSDSFCDDVVYEGDGAGPEFLLVSDLPMQGGLAASSRSIEAAIEVVLRRRDFRAGPYRIGYQSCDDSSAAQAGFDLDKCTANARAYASNPSVLAIVGPVNSFCAFNEVPIANRAGLAVVSPQNSDTSLTRDDSPEGNFLEQLYPTGVRNYARVMPNDHAQGAAHAMLAAELGVGRVFVLGDDERLLVPFRRAAERLGVEIAGEATWDPDAGGYAEIVDQITGSGAGMVFIAGFLEGASEGRLLRDLRARLGKDFPISTGDGWWPEGALEVAGDAAIGLLITTHGTANSQLPPEGQAVVAELAKTLPGGDVPSFSAVYGAQAAEVLLDAIARSDGTRASVVQQLFATRVVNGLIGDFRFDANGDPTLQTVTFLRVVGGDEPAGDPYGGSVVDRVITVPPEFLEAD